MKANDITAALVERLVAQIDTGADDFMMPWHQLAATGLPRNATTHNPYTGVNVMALWFETLERTYPTPIWATYRQWASLGGQVRKGERSTHCIRWVTKNNSDDNDGADTTTTAGKDDDDQQARRRAFPVGFCVFNIAQVDDVELPPAPARFGIGPDRDRHLQTWFDHVPAAVTWGAGRASYNLTADHVVMPHWETFRTTDGAYSTLAHELAHWTGHPRRLGRTYGQRFGDDAYAVEELTAELSAALTCATLGMDVLARTDHAAYLASWCRVLRADPNVLHTVAGKAQAATDHLTSYQPAAGDDRWPTPQTETTTATMRHRAPTWVTPPAGSPAPNRTHRTENLTHPSSARRYGCAATVATASPATSPPAPSWCTANTPARRSNATTKNTSTPKPRQLLDLILDRHWIA